MAKTLADAKYEVHVLEWDRDANLKEFEIKDNISVHRFRHRASYGMSLIYLLPLWWLFIARTCLTNRFHVIQPQNLDNLLPVWFLRPVKGFKIVYALADFYSDAYIPLTYPFLRSSIRFVELSLIKTVTATILVDEARIAQIGFQPRGLTVIYNSPPDMCHELLLTENTITESYDSFNVFYAGGISEAQGVYLLADACQNTSGVTLKVAGFGNQEKHFVNYVRTKKSILFLGRIPYEQVLNLAMKCDCIVVLYDPKVPNMVYASPNKLFEAMMCGKPVIVSAGTAMAKKVMNENCGLVINSGSIVELEKALNLLKGDRGLSLSLGLNGRKAYLEKYDWRLMEKRIVTLYNSLIFHSHRANKLKAT